MDEVQSRLVTCFRAVFPGLDEPAILQLTQGAYPQWDSLASVTLLRLIEEQFGVEMDLFDLEDLDSFAAMEAYIRKRTDVQPA